MYVTHMFCPIKRLKMHFYGLTALWQRKTDWHFAVAHCFSEHVSKVLQEHLGNAVPALPSVSATVPLNRFPTVPLAEAWLGAF